MKRTIAGLVFTFSVAIATFAATSGYEWTGYQTDAYQSTLKGVFKNTATGTDLDLNLPMLYKPFIKQGKTTEYPAYWSNWLSATINGQDLACGSLYTPISLSFTEVEQDGTTTDNSAAPGSIACTATGNPGTTVVTINVTFSGTNTQNSPFAGTATVETSANSNGEHAFDVKWAVTY
jgi:hypothetical protein